MKIMYNSLIKSNHWVAIAKEEGFVWKIHLFFGNKNIFFSYDLNSDGNHIYDDADDAEL